MVLAAPACCMQSIFAPWTYAAAIAGRPFIQPFKPSEDEVDLKRDLSSEGSGRLS